VLPNVAGSTDLASRALVGTLEKVVRRALDDDVNGTKFGSGNYHHGRGALSKEQHHHSGGGVAACAESARVAMDLLRSHRAFERETGLSLSTLAFDLASGAVDAVKAAVEAVGVVASRVQPDFFECLATIPSTFAADVARAAFRLAGRSPKERRALAKRRSLVRKVLDDDDETDQRSENSSNNVVVEALAVAGKRLGDPSLVALVEPHLGMAAIAEEDEEDDSDVSEAEASPRTLRRLSSLQSKKKVKTTPKNSPRPSSESSRPPTPPLEPLLDDDEEETNLDDDDDDEDFDHKPNVETARALVGEAILSIARIAVALRQDDGSDDERKRKKEEDVVYRGAALDAARNGRAEYFLLHAARALRRRLRLESSSSSSTSVLDADGSFVVASLVASWLEKLEESALDNYLNAWAGAVPCDFSGERDKKKLLEDPHCKADGAKLIRKRVATVNAHLDRLVAASDWPDPHPEIGTYLRSLLDATVCAPFRNFHRSYLGDGTPFNHRFANDALLRWTPDALDNALHNLFRGKNKKGKKGNKSRGGGFFGAGAA